MGNRSGQGGGMEKPKRGLCPECGKKGVTGWKATQFDKILRECQYCCWTEALTLDEFEERQLKMRTTTA